ncbi:MAG: hypothetical protein ABJA93_13285, partial [Sporichthyaceae bacterium]
MAEGDSPAWSPDGRVIVFESARIPGHGKDIYLMDATGANQRQVVTHPGAGAPRDTGNDFDPAWAPNDDIIVFTSDRSGSADLWQTNSVGHATDQLTSSAANEGSAAWSPDGTKIAFVSNATGTSQIYVMNVDGDDTHPLTQDPAGAANPTWSPTGD